MPSYNFICKKHKQLVEVTRRSTKPLSQLSAEEREKLELCPAGDGIERKPHAMERNPNPPHAQKKETLDNGAMRHKLERFVDAEQLYKDRANKNK